MQSLYHVMGNVTLLRPHLGSPAGSKERASDVLMQHDLVAAQGHNMTSRQHPPVAVVNNLDKPLQYDTGAVYNNKQQLQLAQGAPCTVLLNTLVKLL